MSRFLTLKKSGSTRALSSEPLPQDAIVSVGSNPGATIMMDAPDFAAEHFVVLFEEGRFVLLSNENGVLLNGEPLVAGGRAVIEEGDVITVGGFDFAFEEKESIEIEEGAQQIKEKPVVRTAAAGHDRAQETTQQVVTVSEREVSSEHDSNDTAEEPDTRTDRSESKEFSRLLTEIHEEDTYHFQLTGEDHAVERIPFPGERMWIGFAGVTPAVADTKSALDIIYGKVGKDWSGVVLYPRADANLLVNEKTINEPLRLKDKDRIVLAGDNIVAGTPPALSFHEPVSLMALSSILPEEIPKPVAADADNLKLDVRPSVDRAVGVPIETTADGRLYLGYFTLLEVGVMALGTLVTAAIIFLVLEMV